MTLRAARFARAAAVAAVLGVLAAVMYNALAPSVSAPCRETPSDWVTPQPVYDPVAARLGEMLYASKFFVLTSKRTCASCHPTVYGGTDCRLHEGKPTRPTYDLPSASYLLRDGSGKSIEDVVTKMSLGVDYGNGGSASNVLGRLRSDGAVCAAYARTFPGEPLAYSNAVYAVGQYMLTLRSANTPFDNFCLGRTNALSVVSREGLEVFRASRCTDCHNGPALGRRVKAEGVVVPPLRGLGKRLVVPGGADPLKAAESMPRFPSDPDRALILRAFLGSL